MTLNLNKTILLLIIIGAIVVAVIFFIENSNSQKTIVMGVTEYLNDGNYTINKTSHVFFNDYRSLKPGDTLIIKDKIVQPPKYGYDRFLKINATSLTISGPDKDSWPIVIYVKENVTDEYKVGDLIEVTLHIGYYDIHQKWYDGSMWHIYGELPDECILNGEYTGGEIIVPPTQVKKVG